MSEKKRVVSRQDEAKLAQIRRNVTNFVARCGRSYDAAGKTLLDIAPQDHEGAKPYFPLSTVETLDIDPNSNATYIADLCATNEHIPEGRFDHVVCTEVLGHTRQPFAAVAELYRMLAPGGLAFVTTPFNFRIHGPLPDCWRFTEYGLRELFRSFELVELEALEDEERFLMPVQYTLVARKGIQ
jgi:SAM-dependent methyltransferase